MCGICGILNYGNANSSVSEQLLKKMSDSIAHRGPDDEGHFVSPKQRCGFGFRRLAIVDLSPAGHQPMHSPDGNVTIMLNGEIYNHLVIRKELEARGYKYRSRSDTETILYAYQEYGLEFVHKLLGMFAIAIWDESKQRLVLVRDRIGIKPIYYTRANGNFVFASEIKALLQHPDVHKELDTEAMEYYLTFMIPPAPRTLFKGIHKLEPGHFLVVTPDGTVKNEQYWKLLPDSPQPSIDVDGTPIASSRFVGKDFPMTEESCVDSLRLLLKQSIKDRMMSDVPFGVFLSGGIDSSTNVALMADLMDRPVDTFSVGFGDLQKYNELEYARQIATEFKTNHHEVIIDQKMAMDFLPKLVHHQDEPIADPVCIPLYFVSKLARENGTIVVQVGEGSDEQFAGYSWMMRELKFHDYLWRPFTALPQFLRTGVYQAAKSFLVPRQQFLALDYIRRGAANEELFWGGAMSFTESHKEFLFNGHDRHRPDIALDVKGWHEESLRSSKTDDYLGRMIYLEMRNRLPELLLMRVDKMSMATSIEARVPFLDHRIVEFSQCIPNSLKLKNGVTKYLLKKAVEGIIPENIIYRRKQGFAAPVNEWLRGDWSSFVESKLLNSYFVRSGLFRKEFIQAAIEAHRRGTRLSGMSLWTLLNLTLWYEHWFEGENT